MSLLACPPRLSGSGGFAGELTRLNCDGQFKPFVYLNGREPDLCTGGSVMATILHRPGERRDPYAVSSRLRTVSDTFSHKQRPGLWVPAFAGTTRRMSLTPQKKSPASRRDLSLNSERD